MSVLKKSKAGGLAARLERARSVDHDQLARLIYGVEERNSAADGGLNA